MAIGYLQVQVRTALDAVPLESAQVEILDDAGTIRYRLTTDASGDAMAVPLETTSRAASQTPDSGEAPYVRYGVRVTAAGFLSAQYAEIPIFAGETARLPMELLPRAAGSAVRDVQSAVVGEPAVARDRGRDQMGAASDAAVGGRVLRQVVIPDPITVHLGAPGDAAANVRIPFLDYVKNVASSEIYPTWPAAALRANIYAVMTFALNRVYTEWYRSRGYGFDITASTAYDQYYRPGGPVYSSISSAVDALFGDYVRRQGQYAPYFTSFCNGSTVSCQGLSQWGTVTLANRGYTPLQILRNYYPDDIEIAETEIITGAVSSYAGTALRRGSRGLDVETVQTHLDRIRWNYPAVPAISDPAGTFGAATEAAVRKFQSVFGLTADGIVGKTTWYQISQIYTAVTRLSELESEGTTLGIGTVPPGVTLRRGMQSQDVVTLQYLLDVIAQYDAAIPAPVQDGVFGDGTRQAVMAFQRRMGLTADGVVGAQTWDHLYRVYGGINGTAPAPGPETDRISYTVRSGDTLWLLAQRYGTTVQAIRQANGLTDDALQIGQVLQIPVTGSPYVTYTVQSGDTLWLLARRYGTTVQAIRQANGLTGDALQIGQILRIPAA